MERLKEIDIIRTFVIILLVLYHALAPYCGGWDMPSYAQPNEGFYWGGKLAYSGMLETFVLISGYVFAFSLQKKVISFQLLLAGKLKRLFVPCMCWGIIMTLIFFGPSKLLNLEHFWKIIGGYGHLWFLPMLFWCFLMEYGIQHCLKGRNLMLVLMIIAILPWPGIPFRFNQSLYYLLFFHLGGIFFRNRERLRTVNWSTICILSAVYMGLFIAVTLVLGMDGMRPELASDLKVKVLILFVHHTLKMVSYGLVTIIYVAVFIKLEDRCNGKLYTVCRSIAMNSMGIYVMQEIVLRLIYYRMGGVFLYTKELTPLVAFVGTFIVCYVSSVIIAGCKYTKFLC